MIPNVSISKTDGNLSASQETERILAIVGPARSGTVNVPASYSTVSDVETAFGGGPLVEAAAYMIGRGIPVVLCRSAATTAAAYGSVTATKTGTATIAAGVTAPDDDYDVRVEIVVGGALGTAGIIYRYSLDGGNTYSVDTALGTSLTLTCANGVSFALTAASSTLIAGDFWVCTTTGPKSNASDIDAAQDTFKDFSGEWLRMLVLADGDATMLSQCDAFARSFHVDGKYPEVIIATRARGSVETRPAYQTELATIAAAVQSLEVMVCADQCELLCRDARRLRKPTSIPVAARLMLIDDSQDAAAKALGALPGVFLTTAAGVNTYHDERRFPGLDGLGFTTLRTWGGRPISPGAYVNNPRILSGAGSDYRYFQHSAIVNRIIESSFQLLQPKLSQSVLVDTTTGKIREDVAASIEAAVNGELRTRFVDPGRVSGLELALSRLDNVLTTDTVSFSVNAVPLGVIKKFVGKSGLARVLPS